MTFLAIERGKDAGQRVEIKGFPVSIGRDPSNDVLIRDSEASRQHMRIKQRGRLFILEDLDSRNGTFVNGDRVVNTTITSGDKILIGGTELVFFAPDDDVHIATDLVSFDIKIDEKAGIKGPIGISPEERQAPLPNAIRLDPVVLANNVLGHEQAIRDVFNLHSNLMVIRDLGEACSTLLKSVGKVLPHCARASLFLWSERNRSLIPYAQKTFHNDRPFQLNQKAFEDAIHRKQGILLEANRDDPEHALPARLILPVAHNEGIVALVHCEFDRERDPYQQLELESAQALLNRASPIIESMLLRRELDSWLIGIMDTVISTVEAKDTYTRGHSERVSNYCMAIADELKLNREIKKLLMISALCHDIGKIGVPDAILKKASMLSAEEYAEMKLHPTIGADIISNLPNSQRIISGVKYHHEKWDGTGYPDGLAGEEIPFFGRIVAIADVFDAMISGRAYSGFMGPDEAVSKLHDEAELFDPEILKAFARAHENGTLSQKTSTQNQELPEGVDDVEVTQTDKL
jgi:HD-GYP domain-containing protein (c-di-GMP phosphodiesterase class II)